MSWEQRPARRPLSVTQRRDLMWNFTQPGDPYDIRKSMIAKLPGEKKPMAPHLELVCLLQAAEIERLSQCLEEFQMRLREGERVELDRHSYEVQIKELTQKIADDHNSRFEIEKLKEFIRRQTIQLQEQKRLAHDSQLSNNYQESLREIAELTQKNNLLQQALRAQEDQRVRQFQISKEQKSEFIASLSRSQKSLKEISFKLQTQKQQIELQAKSTIQAQQEIIKSLQDQNAFYKKQIERLQLESTKAKQLSQTISEYQSRFQIVAEQIDRLNQVLRNKAKQLNEEYARSNQLKEMNRQKDAQLVENQKNIRSLYESITKLQRQQRQAVASLTDLEQHKSLVHSYEASLEKLSIEVDRLNNVLRKKLAQLQETRKKANDLQVKVRSLEASERESGEFRLRASEANRRLSTFERDNARIIQQNERLDYSLKKLIQQMNHQQFQAEGQLKQNDNLRQTIDILNSQINKQRDEKKQMSDHLSRYQEIIQQSKLTYERKLEQYRSIIKELQTQIEEKSHEAASAKSSQSQTQLRLKQAETVSENDQQYIQQLINTKRQLEDRLQQAQIAIAKFEHQTRPPMIDQGELISRQYQEIERLNDVLLNKQNDLKNLQQELHKQQAIRQGLEDGRKGLLIELGQLQERNHVFQQELIKKQEAVTYYLNDNQVFYKQNAQLKNNLEERDVRIQRLQIQLDKLNEHFRSTPKSPEKPSDTLIIQQQNSLLKQRYGLLKQQAQNDQLKIQNLKEQIINLRYELDQLQKSVVIDSKTSPSKIQGNQNAFDLMAQRNQMIRQIEFLRQNCDTLNHDNTMMHNQIIFLRDQTSKMQSQVTYGGSGAKTDSPLSPQKQVQLRQKNEQIAEYYSKILIFSQEIERLNSILLLKQKQSQEKDSIIINLQTQFRSVPQQQTNLLSVKILQLQQKLKDYEVKQGQNMAARDQQRRLFQGKIEILQIQIIRLNDVLSSKIKQNEEIRLSLTNYQRQLNILNQTKKDSAQLQRIKNEYEIKISQMSQQIQRLNSLLQGKERYFSNMSQQYNRKDVQNKYKIQELSIKLSQAEEKLDMLNNQISGLKNRQKLQSLQLSNFSEFEEKIIELSGEVDRLNRLLYSNRQRIGELQSKEQKYLSQIQRLNNSLRLKVQQSSFFEIKERSFIQQKQYLSKGRQSVQFQLRKAATQNQTYRQHISQYKNKIKELYQQFERLQKVMSLIKTQNEELKRQLYSKQSSIQQLIQKNRYLGVQIQRLTNLNLKQVEQLSFLRLKISEDDYLQRRINQDLGLFVVLFAQIETLRVRVQEQIDENDKLRKQNIKSRLV